MALEKDFIRFLPRYYNIYTTQTFDKHHYKDFPGPNESSQLLSRFFFKFNETVSDN